MRLIRSLSFRLTVAYALLFAASVSVLTGVYYWVSIQRPMDQVKQAIRHEADILASIERKQGKAALIAALDRRRTKATDRLAYHTLLMPDGRLVSGNLPSWPLSGATRWLRIEADIYRDGDEEDHEALVLDRPLPGGYRLLVGRDIEDLDDREEGVQVASLWLVVVALLLAAGGGFLMSRVIGRRIEAIGLAARNVIDGDLSRRIAVHNTGDDFDALSKTLNVMLDRIEDLFESVRRVSDSVAHELRTPLVRLHADLVDLQQERGQRNNPLLSSALAEAERLKTVFDAVLRIARIEAGRHEADMRPVDLGAIISDAVELYQPAADERDITLEADWQPDLTVTGDADLLFQALCNLLDNAIKYAPVGGAVSVAAREVECGVEMTIIDNGPGIAADLREKVFERFYRLDQTSDAPGFGLGLALVRGIASLHRARVSLEDAYPGLKVIWISKH